MWHLTNLDGTKQEQKTGEELEEMAARGLIGPTCSVMHPTKTKGKWVSVMRLPALKSHIDSWELRRVTTRAAVQAKKPSAGIAAILSLIIPGTGSMYAGDVVGGMIWLFLSFVGYCFFIVPGLFLHFFSIIFAVRACDRA